MEDKIKARARMSLVERPERDEIIWKTQGSMGGQYMGADKSLA